MPVVKLGRRAKSTYRLEFSESNIVIDRFILQRRIGRVSIGSISASKPWHRGAGSLPHWKAVSGQCAGLLLLAALWLPSAPTWAQAEEANGENANDAETGTDPTQNDPQPAAAPRFDLLELRVKGNSTLDKNQLERTLYPFLGPQKSIDDVESARAALEKLYQTNGYQTVGVDIPEQNVKNGVVYLQVVEGKVARLRVKDARYFSLGNIKAAVPELAEGTVPNFPKMQQQLAHLATESPDRQIVPILRAGETPGTLEVDLKVKDDMPLHGKLEMNGRNTANTSRTRLVASLRYDNLWQRMHSASLMYQVSPEQSQEVDVWAGTYAMPLFDGDSRLVLYAVNSSSSAQVASAGDLSVIGNGQIYGMRWIKPFKALGRYFHNGGFGGDYKHFSQNLKLLGADDQATPISYVPFVAQYGGNYRGESATFGMDLGLHWAFRGLGSDEAEFNKKRIGSNSNFMYVTGNFDWSYDLPYGMQWVGRFAGQAASEPLISNEQFSLGGMQSVRGYNETQALTDSAAVGSLELRSPHLGAEDWDYLNELKLLAFFDFGKGWVEKPSSGQFKDYVLTSAGLGMQFQMLKHFNGVLALGIPLTTFKESPDAELTGGTVVHSGDPRVDFKVATEF